MNRLQSLSLLATVQTALGSGSWVTSRAQDPDYAVARLEVALNTGLRDEIVNELGARLADVASEAMALGDWLPLGKDAESIVAELVAANDQGPTTVAA